MAQMHVLHRGGQLNDVTVTQLGQLSGHFHGSAMMTPTGARMGQCMCIPFSCQFSNRYHHAFPSFRVISPAV